MLDVETKRRIDTARDILVGKVPDPKSQVEQITIALIYKFMDDMDAEAEELGGERTFFKGEFERYGWTKLMAPNMGGYDVITLYSESIQKMNENPNIPQLFRDIFKNAYLPYRDPETLKEFLKVINKFDYDHSERLGDAFEYLLSVLGSQGEAGQFRTPRHIIDFMVEVIEPRKNESILDPACGTAGFLISSYKHIRKHNSSNFRPEADREAFDERGVSIEELTLDSPKNYRGDLLTPDDRARLSGSIRGLDISPDMVRLSLVNMYLHGFTEPHIYEYDTLTSEERWNEFYDIILANPPFMSPKGGIKPHKRFSVQSNRSEVLFVDYIAEHITPTGRAAVIVPEGIIFQSGTAYKQLRKMLVENYLFAVVSLPAGVFNPYSGVKTSILFMDKPLAKKTDKILFVKIENDGFGLGAQRRPIDRNDLPEALKVIQDYKSNVAIGATFEPETWPNVLVVDKERISENGDYNLSGDRYRAISSIINQKWPYVELSKVCLKITDGSHFSPEIVNSGFPYVTVKDLNNGKIDLENCKKISHADYLELVKTGCKPQTNDILFSKDGTVGKAAIVDFDKDFVVLSSIAIIRPDINIILPKYLYFLLSSDRFIDIAVENKTGVAIRRIVLKTLKTIQLPLPPLEVQKEIVAEIEGYQKIIDGARQVVENYKPQIQIDPAWEMVELGEVAENLDGKRIPVEKSERRSGPYPYYGASGIVDYVDKYLFNEALLLVSEDGANLRARVTPIAFSVSGKVWINNHAHVLKFKHFSTQKFVEIYLNSIDLDNYITGSAQPKLNQKSLNSISIPVPDLETQNQIVARIEKEQELVNANKEIIKIFEQKIKDRIAAVWGENDNIKPYPR